MARAHFVRRARKAVPNAGIKVGDSYYWWKFRRGGKHYSKTAPRASQLTSSDKKSRAYAAAEQLEDIASGVTHESTIDELRSALKDVASDINELAEEYREARENMPENLQDSDVGQLCEENADSLESWASEIEQLADGLDEDEFDHETAQSEISDQAGSCPL